MCSSLSHRHIGMIALWHSALSTAQAHTASQSRLVGDDWVEGNTVFLKQAEVSRITSATVLHKRLPGSGLLYNSRQQELSRPRFQFQASEAVQVIHFTAMGTGLLNAQKSCLNDFVPEPVHKKVTVGSLSLVLRVQS